ncbi:MurR/RpiR family transcriptional regulator [Spiroplasma culicicola]|uniref:Transcriptional regulator n=1 Tax=Spiroplasma culicicola AES-1 TaxID=1276246 RepID=W6A738_9MOLU|nr:MurR/RpiR family transcriptional regulator [Spiroplasma culicicola]AHI52781.1 transcriptional regulator [Spiroplasma culicicola AES-1]
MKNNFSSLIKKNTDKFSKKENKIIEYINNNLDKIDFILLNDIIENCDIGYSTFYGFLKKIKLDNFKALILSVKKDLIDNEIASNFIKNGAEESLILVHYFKLLKLNSEKFNHDLIEAIIKNIFKANHIYFIGLGESYLTAMLFSNRLSRFGFKTSVIDRESGQMLVKAMTMDKNDLLFAISMSGETKIILNAIEIAKENGTTIIGLSERGGHMEKLCDISALLQFIVSDKMLDEAYISNMLPMIYFIDVISKFIVEKDEKFIKHRQKTSDVISLKTKFSNNKNN